MKTPRIHWIRPGDPPDSFPDAESALDVPDGLLAAGGDLSSERLLYAYAHGIFPWYNEGEPIIWWSPDPRCVIDPARFAIARRSLRAIRNSGFSVSFNLAFEAVIEECAVRRPGQSGTWITTDMVSAYCALHREGWAHSVEVWQDDELFGGVYGIAIGRGFFGESMFSRASNASKAALAALCAELVKRDFRLLDCQVESPHLMRLGARLLPRKAFLETLSEACRSRSRTRDWPPGKLPIERLVGPPALQ